MYYQKLFLVMFPIMDIVARFNFLSFSHYFKMKASKTEIQKSVFCNLLKNLSIYAYVDMFFPPPQVWRLENDFYNFALDHFHFLKKKTLYEEEGSGRLLDRGQKFSYEKIKPKKPLGS